MNYNRAVPAQLRDTLQGFLLINREVVSADIPDFEYTPLPDFKGPFTVRNLPDEQAILRAFLAHIREVRPNVFVTYNGDYFDWPFIDTRCSKYGISLAAETGFSVVEGSGGGAEYRGRTAVHIDCLYWVKRDSYLPQGSHGLKSVTKAKLGYDPVETDPEEMLDMAVSKPQDLASYSASDAVATYYLYAQYIHSFIFSLATVIPLNADDVLRKGSGTLCETLLMAEAFACNIVCPNKQVDAVGRTFEGHVLETETYLGGHVECLETGVYRRDLPTDWKLVPAAFDGLISSIDRALTFAIEVEHGKRRADVTNYDDVRDAVIERLERLRDAPHRREEPVIYHLDVAAMYPNIILTNRLQPSSIVDRDTQCAGCDFNDPEGRNRCQRELSWRWRGEYYPASSQEVAMLRAQLWNEEFDGVAFADLPASAQDEQLKARLKTYSQRAYKRFKDTAERDKTATVCQRENPFYVNTVRAFRDRRYEYKGLTKKWAKECEAAEQRGEALAAEAARARHVLYDSLQLAHKCILNSFYGYVMRKGARWHSMEMAGVVTYTGSQLIQQARQLVEQVGRPLELDTDGIWCILPASFPQKFDFTLAGGGKLQIHYPCVMLNADVHERYTNHQYQELLPRPPGAAPGPANYNIRSECSIFFELDGPYAAMILPASQEEGKLLKKRYAVFDMDGSLAELKGFELKRRGELKMIKAFQSELFERFLMGDSLESCYAAVAVVADYWLDVLDTQGEDLDDAELVDLLSENRSMSRTLEDYGEQKSVAISTAKRLAEFLGGDMVKDKGLACKLLVIKKPAGAPVSDRAIPTSILGAEPAVQRFFLRKWTRDSSLNDFDIRSLLDWDYYRTRLSSAIQKIITIPAALQRIRNPVPRVTHPEWLTRAVSDAANAHKQTRLSDWLQPASAKESSATGADGASFDIEDGLAHLGGAMADKARVSVRVTASRAKIRRLGGDDDQVSEGSDVDAGAAAPIVVDEAAAPPPATDANQADAQAKVQPPAAPAEVTPPSEILDAPPLPLGASSASRVAAWLAARKAQWAASRALRKRLRAGGPMGADGKLGGGPLLLRGKGGQMSLALASRSAAASTSALVPGSFGGGAPPSSYWQIVEVRDEDEAVAAAQGRRAALLVWAFTSQRRLELIRVTADRSFIVARRCREEDASGFLSTMGTLLAPREVTLPRDSNAPAIYRVRVPESRFRRNAGLALKRALDDPQVLGVYETRASPQLRALIGIGCVAELSSATRSSLAASNAAAAKTMALALVARKAAARAAAAAAGGRGKSKAKGRASLEDAPPPLRQSTINMQPQDRGATAAAASASGDAIVRIDTDVDALPDVASAAIATSGAADAVPPAPSEAAEDGAPAAVAAAVEVAVDGEEAADDGAIAPGSDAQDVDVHPALEEDHSDGGSDDDSVDAAVPSNGAADRDPLNDEIAAALEPSDAALAHATAVANGENAVLARVSPASVASAGREASPAPASRRVSTSAGLPSAAKVPLRSSAGEDLAAARQSQNGSPRDDDAPPVLVAARRLELDEPDALSDAHVFRAQSAVEVASDVHESTALGGGRIDDGTAVAESAPAAGAVAVAGSSLRGRRSGRGRGAALSSSNSNKVSARAARTGGVSLADTRIDDDADGSGGVNAGGRGRRRGAARIRRGGSGHGDGLLGWAMRGADMMTSDAGVLPPLVDADSIEHATTTTHAYLTPASSVYRRALLYHSSDATGSRAVTVLFIIEETNVRSYESAYAILVRNYTAHAEASEAVAAAGGSPSRSRRPFHLDDTTAARLRGVAARALQAKHVPVTVATYAWIVSSQVPAATPAFKRLFRRAAEAVHADDTNKMEPLRIVNTERQSEAWRFVSQRLSAEGPFGGAGNPALIVVASTPYTPAELSTAIPALAMLPLVPAPFSPLECVYPSLDWATAAVQHAMVAFFRMPFYWDERLGVSRFVHVPIANLADAARRSRINGVSSFTPTDGAPSAAILAADARARAAWTDASSDAALYTAVADVLFSRILSASRQVLWLSPRNTPDLGGAEVDASGGVGSLAVGSAALSGLLALSVSSSATPTFDWDGSTGASGSTRVISSGADVGGQAGEAGPASVIVSPSPNPTIAWPGVYRCFCIELQVRDLAVATLLHADALAELAGGGGSDALSAVDFARALEDSSADVGDGAPSGQDYVTGSGGLTGGTTCFAAFRVLRRLVQTWASNRGDYGDTRVSRALLSRFYSWLASPASLMHEPMLHRLVHGLMSTAFRALLGALRAAGCVPVLASMSSITVATGVDDEAAGEAALVHALARLRSHALFSAVTLTPMRRWRHLLVLDAANYSGMLVSPLPLSSTASQPVPDASAAANAAAAAAATLEERTVTRIVAAAHAADGLPLSKATWQGLRADFESAIRERLTIDSTWNISDYLSPQARAYFLLIVPRIVTKTLMERLHRLWARLQERYKALVEPQLRELFAAGVPLRSLTGIAAMLDANVADDETEDVSVSGSSVDGSDIEGGSRGSGQSENEAEWRGTRANEIVSNDNIEMGTPAAGVVAYARQHRTDSGGVGGSGNDASGDIERPRRRRHTPSGSTPDTAPHSSALAAGRRLDLQAIRALLFAPLSAAEERDEKEADAAFTLAQLDSRTPTGIAQQIMTAVTDSLAEEAKVDLGTHALSEINPDTEEGRAILRRVWTTSAAESAAATAPTLALVKTFVHVLLLDESTRDAALRVRATQLALLGVREFSAAARFADPCATFVLPDVACAACNTMRDVDLARDPHLRVTVDESCENLEDGYRSASFAWHCAMCDAVYDRDDVETSLVAVAEARSSAYTLQDVFCAKCRRARSSPVRAYCECSGRYVNAEPPARFAESMGRLRAIARTFHFEWLAESLAALGF